MARQIDLGGTLPVTHNALERISISPHVGQIDLGQILDQWRDFIQTNLLQLIKDVTGIDLRSWDDLFGGILSETGLDLTGLEALLSGKWDILGALQQALQGIDLANPGSVLAKIVELAGQALGFKGVIPVSWIADVEQDLLGGSGSFLSADSVADNPAFEWDADTPGWKSGGSVKTTANGQQNVLGSPTFDVAKAQVLNQQVAVKWSGLVTPAGSAPIKAGFRPFDASGSVLPDVFLGEVQPAAVNGDWQWVPVDTWTVPDGVASVAQVLVVTASATAGTIHFSDAKSWSSNILQQELVNGLTSALDNLASGLGDAGASIAQLLEILAGVATSPIDAALAAVQDWWNEVAGKTSKLDSATGSIDGSAVSGAIDIAQLPDVQSVVDQIATVVNDGVELVDQGIATIASNVGTIFGSAQNAQRQSTNNAAEIAALKAAATGAGNSGASGSDQFLYTANSLNTTTWDFVNTGVGNVRVNGNDAYWSDSGADVGSELDRYKAVTTVTDCFIVSCVMASLMEQPLFGSAECYNWLLGRMSADRQNYVGMRLGYNSLSLWKVVAGAAPVQIGATQPFTLSTADRPALVCGVDVDHQRTFRMLVNDNPVGPDLVDNSGTLSPFGASYRQGGLRWDATFRFGGQSSPGNIGAFTIADWVSPTYVGSTARMARGGSTVNTANGTSVMANNAYNSLVYCTPDITADLVTGKFTVSVKGNYLVRCGLQMANTNAPGAVTPIVFASLNGVPAGEWDRGAAGGWYVDNNGNTLSFPGGEVTSVIAMNPGDFVQSGYVTTGAFGMTPKFSIVRLPTGI
jgi:hypothetical protein